MFLLEDTNNRSKVDFFQNLNQDPRKNQTSQRTLQDQLTVMAAVDIKRKNCNECFDSIQKKREEKKKGNNPVPYKPRHCHCEQLNPEEGLVCDCSGGKPYRRYKSSLKDQQDNKSVTDAIRSERKELDEKKSNDDLMKEVTKFRKKVRMEKMNKEKSAKGQPTKTSKTNAGSTKRTTSASTSNLPLAKFLKPDYF